MVFLDETLAHTRPSLVAAAGLFQQPLHSPLPPFYPWVVHSPPVCLVGDRSGSRRGSKEKSHRASRDCDTHRTRDTKRDPKLETGIMCTLRVLGRSDWSAQLEHYTTYSRKTVAALADKLLANGRASTASAMGLKYTSRRLGGLGDQVGADGKTLNDGCFHILNNYYARTAAPALAQTAVAGPTHLSSSTYSHHPSVHSAYV